MKKLLLLPLLIISVFMSSYSLSLIIDFNIVILVFVFGTINIALLLLNIFNKRLIILSIGKVVKSLLLAICFSLDVFISSPAYEVRTIYMILLILGFFLPSYLVLSLFDRIFAEESKVLNANNNVTYIGIKFYELILLLVPILLFSYWFLEENHALYGDEPAHLQMIKTVLYWIQNNNNYLYKFKVLYVFDLRYPPVFYVLSMPFIYIVKSWITGIRVYTLFLSIINIALMYFYLRRKFSFVSSHIGVLCFVSGVQFVLAGRYYAQEILLITIILFLHIFIDLYLIKGDKKHRILVSLLIAIGLLTKYNFVMYLVPIIIYYIVEYAVRQKKLNLLGIFCELFKLSIFPLLLSSPWYIYTFIINPQMNAISGLISGKQWGDFSTGVSISMALQQIWAERSQYFVDMVYILILLLLLVSLKKIISISSKTDQGRLLIFSITTIIFETILLKLVGINMARWNLSYIYISFLIASLCQYIYIENKIIKLISQYTIILLFIFIVINNSVFKIFSENNKSFKIFSGPKNLLPEKNTTGAVETINLIKQDWLESGKSMTDPIKVGYIGHIHEGLHGHVLSFDGMRAGFQDWEEYNVGILDQYKPANTDVFFDTNYLLFIPNDNRYGEMIYKSYQSIVDNLPKDYLLCTSLIGEIRSRFGIIHTLKIDHDCLQPNTYYNFIDDVMSEGQQNGLTPFWALRKLYFHQLFNDLSTEEFNYQCQIIRKDYYSQSNEFDDYYVSLWEEDYRTICR